MKTLLLLLLPAFLSAQPIPLDASKWLMVEFGSTKQEPIYNPPSGAVAFDFPSKGNRFVDYFEYSFGNYTKLQGTTLTATFSVVTTGTPVFKYDSEKTNTCVTPATVRPYFQTGLNGEFERWWANPISYVLAPGTITLTVPLTPDQWSSVYGKFGNYDATSLAGFQNVLDNTYYIGLSFGGGCFFGHGVNVSGGTAQFQVLSYSTF